MDVEKGSLIPPTPYVKESPAVVVEEVLRTVHGQFRACPGANKKKEGGFIVKS